MHEWAYKNNNMSGNWHLSVNRFNYLNKNAIEITPIASITINY